MQVHDFIGTQTNYTAHLFSNLPDLLNLSPPAFTDTATVPLTISVVNNV